LPCEYRAARPPKSGRAHAGLSGSGALAGGASTRRVLKRPPRFCQNIILVRSGRRSRVWTTLVGDISLPIRAGSAMLSALNRLKISGASTPGTCSTAQAAIAGQRPRPHFLDTSSQRAVR
jgi:hypothetical protein